MGMGLGWSNSLKIDTVGHVEILWLPTAVAPILVAWLLAPSAVTWLIVAVATLPTATESLALMDVRPDKPIPEPLPRATLPLPVILIPAE